MVNQYSINKYLNELKAIQEQLAKHPPVNNLDDMSVEHIILKEEQKRSKNGLNAKAWQQVSKTR